MHVQRGSIATLTIDRVDKMNALDTATLISLGEAMSELENDAEVRVIVMSGAGEHSFVAGADISEIGSRRGLQHYQEFAEVIGSVFTQVEACSKPTIGAVRGYALGGGAELLLALDMTVVAKDALIGFPETTLGLFPGAGGTQRLLRQVAPNIARELMFTGMSIDGVRAGEIGLVNRVVDDDKVMPVAMELAEIVAARSPLALRLLKQTLRFGAEMPPGAGLAYERAMVSLMMDSEDAHEGCDAFLDHRPPRFVGR